MEHIPLKILSTELFKTFVDAVKIDEINAGLFQLADAPISTDKFSFYNAVAAVYSGKIEGENIELDSFVKYRRFGIDLLYQYVMNTDALYEAYSFAAGSQLTEANIKAAHSLLAKNFVPDIWAGRLRETDSIVVSKFQVVYNAPAPGHVSGEMQKLIADIDLLLKTDLTVLQALYFASMIHLVFVKIHPWIDGNGRTARLLEKWFLAQKFEQNSWFIRSEKNYFLKLNDYKHNLDVLGADYVSIDYSKALPFLLMLPNSIINGL